MKNIFFPYLILLKYHFLLILAKQDLQSSIHKITEGVQLGYGGIERTA